MARNHEKESLPIITFDDSLSIHFNGEEIRLIHFPHGHTDNDVVILFTESNVVHMGDLFFTGMFPSFYTAHGGDAAGYAENVGRAIELLAEDVKIIPGHGRLATLDDLRAFHGMMVDTVAIVRERVEAGQSLEEAKAAGLPERFDTWANSYTSIEKWIDTLYKSIARE